MNAAPIVKWAGGKTRLLPELVARIPERFERYLEPFCGGAALFFRLAPASADLSDANADLIEMYRAVRDNVAGVIALLEVYKARHGKEHYYQTRELWNSSARHDWALPLRGATFIYLNKTCYNGLWRVNRRGGFNVPMGDYKDPPILDADGLAAASEALANVQLTACTYQATADRARPGDFVYFDPPYVPLTETANFTSYTEGRFDDAAQCELADVARALVRRGCHVLLSNSDTPRTREIYHDFEISAVECSRAINSKGDARGAVSELIIRGRA